MQNAALYVWMFVVSVCVSVLIWFPPAMIGAILLRRLPKLQNKPWQRAYIVAAAGGMFIGAAVGWGAYFLADFVLRILGREWNPGQRPHWLDLASATGALGVGVVLSVVLMLVTATAHAITRWRAGIGESSGLQN